MSRSPVPVIALASLVAVCETAVADAKLPGIAVVPLEAKIVRQCGISMNVPRLPNIFNQEVGFGCSGSYKNGRMAVLNMYFAFDPNLGLGGSNIGFEISSIGIVEKMSRGGAVLRKGNDELMPKLSDSFSYKMSNCGGRTTIEVAPIAGENWHGWIAEETFVDVSGSCELIKEYGSAYRCVHLMIGNKKMVAQMGGVCLYRKLEGNLMNGFSYDLFVDMVRSIRFNDG